MIKVLVTGGSGFLGSHCILRLLAAGYDVRTTVRNLDKEPQVRSMLRTGGAADNPMLTFMAADLMADRGWAEATAHCDYVLHIASPFPASQPKDENELIVPARDGALRVLRAAREAGAKRVVFTSSFAAVGYGRQHPARPFNEEDWTEEDAPNSAYVRSKTIAERAAWDFIASEGGTLELSVINPAGIFGPALGSDYSTSIGLVKALLQGEVPGPPQTNFGVVDVRDAAELHVLAMTHSQARGQRFIAVSGMAVTMAEVARILHDKFGASRISGELLGDDPLSVPDHAARRDSSNAKARHLLGWSPRPAEDAIVDSAESLFRLGLVR